MRRIMKQKKGNPSTIESSNSKNIHTPIDIVYTWVNGEDPEYLKIYNKYAEVPKDINPERYRDIYQMLKYSVRSVEKFANWIRNIYIITARPQIPDWIDLTNSRIKVIHHDEIIDPQYLPTFNYNVIESCQHQIEGLAEHYISMNDDFLFGNEVYPSDFLDENGRLTIFNTVVGENLRFRIYEKKNDVFSLGGIEHNPIFYKKEYVYEMQELHKEDFHHTRLTKFRRDENVTMQKIFRKHMLAKHRNKSNPLWYTQLLQIHKFHKITNNLESQKKALARLEEKRPKYYCLNDDQRDHPNMDVTKIVQTFLQNYYPEKSSFEK